MKINSFSQVKCTCVDLGRAKSSIFEKFCKHWLEFPHLKRECGASLNARELTRENKVNMAENLQPKHCANRYFHKLNTWCVDLGKGEK